MGREGYIAAKLAVWTSGTGQTGETPPLELTTDWDPSEEVDVTQRGWQLACPYSSAINARQGRRTRSKNGKAPRKTDAAPNDDTSTPSDPLSLSSRTFISSHSALMDVCAHPSIVPIHGVLSHNSPHHSPLTPLFSLSKTSLHSDILGVPFEQWVDTNSDSVEGSLIKFEDKTNDKLLWRGSNTGAFYRHEGELDWRKTHRHRFVELVNGLKEGGNIWEELRVLPGGKGLQGHKGKGNSGSEAMTVGDLSQVVVKRRMNEEWMDVSFAGQPIRKSADGLPYFANPTSECSEEDGTCDELRSAFTWNEHMSHEDALQHKYVFDV